MEKLSKIIIWIQNKLHLEKDGFYRKRSLVYFCPNKNYSGDMVINDGFGRNLHGFFKVEKIIGIEDERLK